MISFLKDTVDELKKLHIPSKKETYVTTVTILITIAIVSLVVFLSDFIISELIGFILGL